MSDYIDPRHVWPSINLPAGESRAIVAAGRIGPAFLPPGDAWLRENGRPNLTRAEVSTVVMGGRVSTHAVTSHSGRRALDDVTPVYVLEALDTRAAARRKDGGR